MSARPSAHRNPVVRRAILALADLNPVTSKALSLSIAASLQSLRKHLQMLANDGYLARRPGPPAVDIVYDITPTGRHLLDALQHNPDERRNRQHRAALDLAHALGYPTGAPA